MTITLTQVRSILTRSAGYLSTVCSHSLQPYRGCALGSSLCGVGCYVQHNPWITRGRKWGDFVEVRRNAAEAYRRQYQTERRWARAEPLGRFSIFLSSSTEPFQPVELKAGITQSLLRAMCAAPPDELIVQTHSHRVAEHLNLLLKLAAVTSLRVHISIESDRDRLPGLPPPASSVARRIAAARALHAAGLFTVITLSPLFPIDDPGAFFHRLSDVADAVVIDHFIGGDGSADGTRTARTSLPAAMSAVHPGACSIEYRDEIVVAARRHFSGRVGVGADGFAARYLQMLV